MKRDTPTPDDLKPIDMHDTAWPLLKSWTDLLIQPLRKDRALADSTLALWCRMLRELRGPEPLKAIEAELNVALSLTFPHTTVYQGFYKAMTDIMVGERKPSRELQVLLDQMSDEIKAKYVRLPEATAKEPMRQKKGK